ncbi:MAG: hypothetical protein QXE76_01140 [Candidatus Bathyarchaeia archaeon]
MAGWLKKLEEKVDLMDLPPSERARLCLEIREALRHIIQETKSAQKEIEETPAEPIEIDEEYTYPKDHKNTTKTQTCYTLLNRIL